jgi:hypothetical protein
MRSSTALPTSASLELASAATSLRLTRAPSPGSRETPPPARGRRVRSAQAPVRATSPRPAPRSFAGSTTRAGRPRTRPAPQEARCRPVRTSTAPPTPARRVQHVVAKGLDHVVIERAVPAVGPRRSCPSGSLVLAARKPSRRRFVGFSLVDPPTREAPSSGAIALLLVRGAFSGADDGIRTRDPHLGNVLQVTPGTSGNARRCALSWSLVCPVRSVVSRCSPSSCGRSAAWRRHGVTPRTRGRACQPRRASGLGLAPMPRQEQPRRVASGSCSGFPRQTSRRKGPS